MNNLRASVGRAANGGNESKGGGGGASSAGKPPKPRRSSTSGGGGGGGGGGKEELREFMLDLGLSAHMTLLTKAEVLTMDDLALMTDEDMKEVGLPKGPRLRIIDAFKKGYGKETLKCKICLDRPVQTVLKPCGHSLMCTVCALSVKHCPICRQKIEESIRWFPTW